MGGQQFDKSANTRSQLERDGGDSGQPAIAAGEICYPLFCEGPEELSAK